MAFARLPLALLLTIACPLLAGHVALAVADPNPGGAGAPTPNPGGASPTSPASPWPQFPSSPNPQPAPASPAPSPGPPSTAPKPPKATPGGWNPSEQRLVANAGVLPNLSDGTFHGEQPLSAGAMTAALQALAQREPGAPPVAVDAAVPLTVVRFDRLLDDELGLADVAAAVQAQVESAGLHPPRYFGTEVVARLLGLRFNHPASQDALELNPADAITRAEAAHSFALALGLSTWGLANARQQLASFTLPRYTSAQRKVLSVAVSKIGMPYVWGGTTDDTSDGRAHGGYDCSGFAWRVYKLSGLPWGAKIKGRTAAQQAGEIPRRRRIALTSVQPGDLLFFGSARLGSRATEASVTHEGIALSGQWAIHSSAQGVYVLPLSSGWLHDSFSWARRVM